MADERADFAFVKAVSQAGDQSDSGMSFNSACGYTNMKRDQGAGNVRKESMVEVNHT